MRKKVMIFICALTIGWGLTVENAWALDESLEIILDDSEQGTGDTLETIEISETESVTDIYDEQQSESTQDNLESKETETKETETVESENVLNIASIQAKEIIETQDMHRLYNPNSGEHFYTSNISERDHLVSVGWNYEGISWRAPVAGDPVYRLYNPNAGDHHYTLNVSERDHLVSVGWNYEGIGWYSDVNKTVPIFRVYNPNAVTGTHHYSANYFEIEHLVDVGWRYEGIGWYSCEGTVGDNGELETPEVSVDEDWIEISNLDEENGKFDVTIYLGRSDINIYRVLVPVWTKDNQSDIKWYEAIQQSDGCYKITVNAMNHQWNSGEYQVHSYIQMQDGKMKFIKQTSVIMNVVNKGFDHHSIQVPDLSTSGIIYFNNTYEISNEKKEKLEEAVNALSSQGCKVGFVMVDLYTGQGVSYNGENKFYSASTIKGPYVTSLSQDIPSSRENHSSYMMETIKNSDNMKYRALKNTYGSSKFEEWLIEAGCGSINAYLEYPDLTPKALTQMWTKMYGYFVSGEENSEWCRDLFVSTKNSFISETLSSKYTVYSKAGWLYASSYIRSQHDGGIVVKDEHPYVIVVLSNAYGKIDVLRNLVMCLDDVHTELVK